MAFWRRISDNVFGEAGPAQIEVTPRGSNVLMRLPNQRYSGDRTIPWLIVAIILGSVVILAVVRHALETEPSAGQAIVIGCALASMSMAWCAWRVRWHYEVLLAPDFLRVDCISTFNQRRVAEVELEPIRQLTLVCSGTHCNLLAESAAEPPVHILSSVSTEEMRELARLIVQHHVSLAAERAELRIVEEVDPHLSAAVDRAEPPLNSRVKVATSHAGLAFDFPLPEDPRPAIRKHAWRMFEIGIVILVGAVIWYAICVAAGLGEARGLAGMAFIAGIVMLLIAGSKSVSSWVDHRQDDDLLQLSVLEKMLVRTSRDHQKRLWYASEIRTIQAVVQEHSSTSEGGEVTVSYSLSLVVELHNGQKVSLVNRPYTPADYRPKAEYEWLATKLRHALLDEKLQAEDSPPSSTAITQLGRVPSEEHVTPTGPASPRRD
jgi:hypothetical protein